MIAHSRKDWPAAEPKRQEHKKVLFLLESVGLQQLRRQLTDMENRKWKETRLSFASLRLALPDFPIYLRYAQLFKLDRHASCSLLAMFEMPERSLIYREWKAFHDSVTREHMSDGRAVGLVFPYGGIEGGWVIHDGEFAPTATVVDRRYLVLDVCGSRLTMQPYLHLLAAIKDSGWRPDAPAHDLRREIVAAPLLRQVKGNTAKLVLKLFIDILNGRMESHPDWTSRIEVVVRLGGERRIALTHQEIGDALGLEVSQVRRALRLLRNEGVINVQSVGSERSYSLSSETEVSDGQET